LHRIGVSSRTTWLVVEVTTRDGITGLGECSDAPHPDIAATIVESVIETIGGFRAGDDLDELDARMAERCANRAGIEDPFSRLLVLGAVTTALADVVARTEELPLSVWLGAEWRPAIPLYANINRAPLKRTPDEFARFAGAAVEHGFERIKLAPFDGPPLPGMTLLDTGLEHLAAVRGAIGGARTMYVDVHHRLDRRALERGLDVMEELEVGWIEDAVDVRSPADMEWLDRATAIPIAGGEHLTDPEEVASVLDHGILSYLLLDPKYVGGVLRFRSMLNVVRGVRLTIHEPTGPVSSAVSAHMAMLADGHVHNEHAFGEAIDRAEVTEPGERTAGGEMFVPSGSGLGLELTLGGLADRCETIEWTT
jgi:galactonate dehydratase